MHTRAIETPKSALSAVNADASSREMPINWTYALLSSMGLFSVVVIGFAVELAGGSTGPVTVKRLACYVLGTKRSGQNYEKRAN